MEMKTSTYPFALKNIDSAGTLFTGIVASFHNVDHGGDVIHPRAYDAHLDEFRRNGVVRSEHETTIGKITYADITSQGLKISGKISDTSDGRDIKVLLRDNVLNRLSIGQFVLAKQYLESAEEVKAHWKSVGYTPSEDDLLRAGGGVRLITSARPVEASVVFAPMNELAVIDSVKAGAAAGSFAQHTDRVLTTLHDYVTRVEDLTGKREDGRRLGPEAVATRLLQSTSAGRQDEIRQLHIRALVTQFEYTSALIDARLR